MSTNKVSYPSVGCLVEFMQGNSPVQAVVLDEQGGRLRLYGINKRETKLQSSRLLPWSGPNLGSPLTRKQMDEALEEHRTLRASIADTISAMDVWELTQDEVPRASAEWLAELIWGKPSIDHEAALGHLLLAAKTHFRFSPPDFDIFPRAMAEARLAEAEDKRAREALTITGAMFFQKLWDVHHRKRGPLSEPDMPEESLAAKLKALILARLADPEAAEDAASWKLLTKGLPDVPHQALILAEAWGMVPEHYNFWLDRAGYAEGENWALEYDAEAERIIWDEQQSHPSLLSDDDGFISVDPASASDRDDAFLVRQNPDGGFTVKVALACPALVWPFGGPLDKAVLRRASSLYFPEGTHHMLPGRIGRDLFSLDAGVERPALVTTLLISAQGTLLETEPALRKVTLKANLDLESCEAALSRSPDAADVLSALGVRKNSLPEVPPAAAPHAPMLAQALALAHRLMEVRIANGAVITERPDPEICVIGQGSEARVSIDNGPEASLAHLVISELMIMCNSALAGWAISNNVPLLYRTQDVALPREFSGIWTEPQDISRVVRALPPATLEDSPRRHTGLGLSVYATLTSPIRRYADLLNQGQVASALQGEGPRYSRENLRSLLPTLRACAETVTQAQRMRPRYWKLLFFRQQGDKNWWDAVVADENEAFVTISLPWAQLLVREKRRQFDEKIYPGMRLRVRLGKVNPLLGQIQMLEVQEA